MSGKMQYKGPPSVGCDAVKVELQMLDEPGWKMTGKIQGLPGNR